MKATLTSKGQITIPRAIREHLHLRPGDVLDFDETTSILVARRIVEPDEWDRRVEVVREAWNGDALSGGSVGDYLDEARGPRQYLIPDFLVAAHAVEEAGRLAAVDRGYVRRYFANLSLLEP